MKFKNAIKFVLILVNVTLLFSTITAASDQQPGADAQVIFQVA